MIFINYQSVTITGEHPQSSARGAFLAACHSIFVPQDLEGSGLPFRHTRVFLNEVIGIRMVSEEYCLIHLTNARPPVRAACSLQALLGLLGEPFFLRIAYDTVLNPHMVDTIFSKGLVVGNEYFDVSERFREEVMETLHRTDSDAREECADLWSNGDSWFVRVGKCAKRVRLAEVGWIEVKGNVSTLHFCSDRKPLHLSIPLKAWLGVLPPEHFLKINKSVIINHHLVDTVITREPYFVFLGKHSFQVSRPYYHALRSALNLLHASHISNDSKCKK